MLPFSIKSSLPVSHQVLKVMKLTLRDVECLALYPTKWLWCLLIEPKSVSQSAALSAPLRYFSVMSVGQMYRAVGLYYMRCHCKERRVTAHEKMQGPEKALVALNQTLGSSVVSILLLVLTKRGHISICSAWKSLSNVHLSPTQTKLYLILSILNS